MPNKGMLSNRSPIYVPIKENAGQSIIPFSNNRRPRQYTMCVCVCVRSQCLLSPKPFTLLPCSQHVKVHKYPEDRGNMYRRNTGTNLSDYNHTSTGHSSAMFLTNKPTVSEVSKRYLRHWETDVCHRGTVSMISTDVLTQSVLHIWLWPSVTLANTQHLFRCRHSLKPHEDVQGKAISRLQ
jgi:hypothetical protein